MLEYQQLRAHLDAHLRVSDAPTSALAARTSKLLRDVPSLANDPHFAPNRREAGRAGTMKQAKDEQMLPYQASMTWDAGRDLQRSAGFYQGLEEGKALGHIGRKEQSRIEEASLQTSDKSFTSLAQRWASPADQSMFQKDIGPLRMPLRTKQTKRCPTCRHIIIRPDTKPTSHRFKIRLLALNHLPEVQVRLPHVSAGAIAKDERRSRSSILPSISRRRPAAIDVEALQPGRTYTFEASFFNPLDDAMMVRLHIARASVRDVEGLPSSSPAEEGEQPAWTATPTASAFPINPFNAVWELEEEENDLLNAADGGDDVFSDLDDNDSAELDVVQNDDRELRRSGPDASGARQKRRRGHGILRKRGHETVIGLALKLGPDALGEIEVGRTPLPFFSLQMCLSCSTLSYVFRSPVSQFPMQITFAHRTEADTATRSAAAASRDAHGGASSSERSFSFWTFVRLGHVSSAGERAGSRILPGEDAPEASDAGRRDGLPTSYTSAEARRTALDKRRSVMGLNVTASTLSATSPPGTAAATPHAQPSVLGESSSES